MKIEEIKKKLEELAFKRTTPFCYMCYQKVPTGICKDCGSDDTMRYLDGVGVEYGTQWVIESIIEEELNQADINESFEQMMNDCYPEEVQVGFLKVNVSDTIKTLDPIMWNIAKGEHESSLEEDEELITIGNKSYWVHEVETFLETT
jgi:hypothetical protein